MMSSSLFFTFVSFLVLCVLALWGVVIPLLKKRKAKKIKEEEFLQYLQDWIKEWVTRKKAWNEKVNRAKRHLFGAKDWRDPHGKEEFVSEILEGKTPQYLWYEVTRKLTDEDVKKIVEFFWGGEKGGSFGDLEMHRSLRIRNAKRFTALLLEEFPLRQIGHVQPFDVVDQDGFPEGAVVFDYPEFYSDPVVE